LWDNNLLHYESFSFAQGIVMYTNKALVAFLLAGVAQQGESGTEPETNANTVRPRLPCRAKWPSPGEQEAGRW
jgi:hypothetical protein